MSISLLLEMAVSSDPHRTAVVSGDLRLTTGELSALADGGAGVIAASGAQHVGIRRHRRRFTAAAAVLLGSRGGGVHAAELPAERGRPAAVDRPSARPRW